MQNVKRVVAAGVLAVAMLPGAAFAQDPPPPPPLVPDIGFDSAATVTEIGGTLGGDLVLVIGIGLAIFAAVFVVRALKRHAKPA